jgi:hypothetical protein
VTLLAAIVVMLLQGLTPAQQAAAIRTAKNLIVRDVDAALPRTTFESWLRRVVGTGPSIEWEVNDCGEQTGDAQTNARRDLPVCVEANVAFSDRRQLGISFAVGTLKKGVTHPTTFWTAYLTVPGEPRAQEIHRLSDVASAIRPGR